MAKVMKQDKKIKIWKSMTCKTFLQHNFFLELALYTVSLQCVLLNYSFAIFLSFFISTRPNICQDLSDIQQSRMAESIEYIKKNASNSI